MSFKSKQTFPKNKMEIVSVHLYKEDIEELAEHNGGITQDSCLEIIHGVHAVYRQGYSFPAHK